MGIVTRGRGQLGSEASIYLDYHATTPCDQRVVQAMLPFFTQHPANASSTVHADGRQAARLVDTARELVGEVIGASAFEIYFTGSATESNNLAILGVAAAAPKRRTIVSTSIEHKSVLAPLAHLQTCGFDVQLISVKHQGRLDMDALDEALSEKVLLVSVQAANSEVGTLQEIRRVADLAHDCGALVHCDAVQAVGRVPVNVNEWGVDLLSLSAHKFYGPKGIAALFVHGGSNRTPIRPIMYGGGQEGALRPGTQNVPAIIGFGEAARISMESLSTESKRIQFLRNDLELRIMQAVPEVRINGDRAARLPGNSSLTFPGVDAEALIANSPDLALSTASACNSGTLEPSHVLLALGLSKANAYETVRIGIGRFTTETDVSRATSTIISAVRRISAMARDS